MSRTLVSVEDTEDLGSRLKAERKRRKWTLERVATAMKVSGHVIVARWENGSREPDAATLSRLADLYGVSVDELLGRRPSGHKLRHVPDPPTPAPREAPSSTPAPDRPTWVDDLRASVTEVSRETSAAILHQEERFVASMETIGEQLATRDADTKTLLHGLMGVIERNTEQLARNAEIMSRLEARLLDDTGPPPSRQTTEEQAQGQWQARGIKIQARTQSEGGASV